MLSLGFRVLFAFFDKCEIGVHNTLWSVSASFDKPDYSISRPYIWNIARTLLSPSERGHITSKV